MRRVPGVSSRERPLSRHGHHTSSKIGNDRIHSIETVRLRWANDPNGADLPLEPDADEWLLCVESSGSIVPRRTAGIGASRPLPSVPPKVASPNQQQTLSVGGGNSSSCPVSDIGRYRTPRR